MPYKGVVKNTVVVLEGGVLLPEGIAVTVIPEDEAAGTVTHREQWRRFNVGADRVLEQLRAKVGTTSDSTDIIRQLREEQASRWSWKR